MAVYTQEPVIPSLIENTVMYKNLYDGVHTSYDIAPAIGYVLHDKIYDYPVLNPETLEETGEVVLGYRLSTAICPINYDFEANPREFYAVLADSVPADQIFGGSDNNHEIA